MTPRVRALRRKMVLAHAEIVLRGLATDFCREWSIAQAGDRPLPDILAFIRRIFAAGFRLPTSAYAQRYLDRTPAPHPPETPSPLASHFRLRARSGGSALGHLQLILLIAGNCY